MHPFSARNRERTSVRVQGGPVVAIMRTHGKESLTYNGRTLVEPLPRHARIVGHQLMHGKIVVHVSFREIVIEASFFTTDTLTELDYNRDTGKILVKFRRDGATETVERHLPLEAPTIH